MTPCRFDFYLPTNGDYVEEIPFRLYGEPLSLAGASFKAQVRIAYDSPSVLLTLNTVNSVAQEGFCVIDPTGGVMQIRMDRESIRMLYDTAVPSAYVGRTVQLPYDALATLPNGDVEQWFGGYMILNKGVTQ